MWKEFKAFVLRGNVLDLAVAVVIGTAFMAIVQSLVGDIIMPSVGILLSGIDLSQIKIILEQAVLDPVTAEVITPEVAIGIGLFLQTIIQFLIISLVIFLVVKGITAIRSRARQKEETGVAPPARPDDVVLLEEIRDILSESKKTY